MKRQSSIRNDRGVAFAYTGIALFAFIGLAAFAVDTAQIALHANEAQVAADAAAASGAIRMMLRPIGRDPRDEATDGAQDTLNANSIGGHSANLADVTVNVRSIQNPACESGPGGIGPGLLSINSVTATVRATVPNLFASFISASPTTDVERSATALIVGQSEAAPTLPVVIGDCSGFVSKCFTESCLPDRINISLVETSNPTTAWSAFDTRTTQPIADIINFLDEECGGSRDPVRLKLNDRIPLSTKFSEADRQAIFKGVQCLIAANQLGVTEFTVPVSHCVGGHLGESHVTGFATVIVDDFSMERIEIRPVTDEIQSGTPGPCFFGRGFVKLIE